MASQIEWANRALDKIGEKPIISLDDGNKQANLLKRMFDIVRDAELRKRRWSFSIARTVLAADVTAPVFGYGAQYQLPTDCLRVLSIFTYDIGPDISDYRSGGDMGAVYRIEGRKILYGRAIPGGPPVTEPMPLRYIAQIADTTLWDACFGEAFACKLAVEIAEPLTQSSDKRKMAWQEYTAAIADAKRANAIELPSESISDDTWVWSRLRG